MIEQAWTFIQTLCKGTVQGVSQYIDNDLKDYIPLFLFAAVALIARLCVVIYRKLKSKKS
jgi:hypothetical protein